MMHINKHGEMFIVDISCKAYKNFPVTSHCSPDNVVFMSNLAFGFGKELINID